MNKHNTTLHEDDFESILKEQDIKVTWDNQFIDGKGNIDIDNDLAGWSLSWKHGCMYIGKTTEEIARKAAALFVGLWLRGVDCALADKLMWGYVEYERTLNEAH